MEENCIECGDALPSAVQLKDECTCLGCQLILGALESHRQTLRKPNTKAWHIIRTFFNSPGPHCIYVGEDEILIAKDPDKVNPKELKCLGYFEGGKSGVEALIGRLNNF